ncbi:hypothetical protein B484DRAFT_281060, partial [Ochromonadaceae sp. CCMP2298]
MFNGRQTEEEDDDDDEDEGEDEGPIVRVVTPFTADRLRADGIAPAAEAEAGASLKTQAEAKADGAVDEGDGGAAAPSAIAELGDALELVRSVEWIRSLSRLPQYASCIRHLPSLQPSAFARNELSLFASILVEVDPIFVRVLEELAKAKEAQEVAMGLRKGKVAEAAAQSKQRKKDRDEKKRLKKVAREAAEAEEAEAFAGEVSAEEMGQQLDQQMASEEETRLAAVLREAEREKAWFMAHPHKFIQHPGEAAFCIVCREKESEFWMRQHVEGEQAWRGGFEEDLQSRGEAFEVQARQATEALKREELETQAEEEVVQEMAQERADSLAGKSSKFSVKSSMKGFTARSASVSSMRSTHSASAPPSREDDEEREEREWVAEMDRLKGLLRAAGLSLLDARGRSILPRRREKKAVVEAYVPPELVEGEEEEGMGLRIRVWHRDPSGARANFLGVAAFTEAEMLDPPKGMRTYPLLKDPAVVEVSPTPQAGSIVVLLRVSKAKHKSGLNLHWRVEILK